MALRRQELVWASRTDEGDYHIVQAWFNREDWEADEEEREELLDSITGIEEDGFEDLYSRVEELCTVEGYYDFYGMAPDGRKFYFPATDQSGQKDLWSVEWTGENLQRESFGDYSPTRIQPTDQDSGGAVFYLSYGSSLRNTDGDLLAWTAPCSRSVSELQRQKFYSAWRMLRDSFYDSGMHGIDWNGMLGKYVPRASAAMINQDFNDVVRRMLGELSASHLGIYGPWEYTRAAYTGETGIFTDSHWRGEGIKVDSVLPMSPAYLAGFLPGDIITAVDRSPVDRNHNWYAPFRNTADREVVLSFIRNGDRSSVRITPVSQWDIWRLTYREWVEWNRRKVKHLSDDRVATSISHQ